MLKYHLIALIFIVGSCSAPHEEDSIEQEETVITTLPFAQLALDDMSAFADQKGNWKTVGSATSDLNEKLKMQSEEGTGVLANQPTDELNSNLLSKMEHGDLELKFEVMMPKESNSGVYFQGRYEIQMLDSWGKSEVGPGDMGGIYERWDDTKPEGQEGYEGTAPKVNASRAPGLWQTFHVLFKAPTFNAAGEKVKNAKFDFVKHNGFEIHRDVELTGPTRGAMFPEEASLGPILIQGDHGPVAFRNIQYKSFGVDTLRLDNLSYDLYHGKYDYIPNFDTLTPVRSGEIDRISLTEISDQPDGYAIVFRGDLHVARAGEYLFETMIDDGGDLTIDSTLLIHNEGEPGMGHEYGSINLTEGIHSFELTFYQEIWSATLLLYYEGPGIERRLLNTAKIISNWQKRQLEQPDVVITEVSAPELLRGFVDHGDTKLTHTISVGHPEKIHYSYDLLDGTMIKSWKGNFADVTNMWRGRGNSQLAIPLNAPVEFSRGIPIARLNNDQAAWPKYRPDDFSYNGYSIDAGQLPTFSFQAYGLTVSDKIEPVADGRKLSRTLSFESDQTVSGLYYKLGHDAEISQLENGLYNVGGKYYIESKEELILRKMENHDELLVAINGQDAYNYQILW